MKEKNEADIPIYPRVPPPCRLMAIRLKLKKNRTKATAEFNDYEIVGEILRMPRKSGKSIEGVSIQG